MKSLEDKLKKNILFDWTEIGSLDDWKTDDHAHWEVCAALIRLLKQIKAKDGAGLQQSHEWFQVKAWMPS